MRGSNDLFFLWGSDRKEFISRSGWQEQTHLSFAQSLSDEQQGSQLGRQAYGVTVNLIAFDLMCIWLACSMSSTRTVYCPGCRSYN